MASAHLQGHKRVARGVINPDRPHMTQVIVSLEHDTFNELRDRAIAQGTSFAEQVRTIIEWGLESAKDYEPDADEALS